MIQFDYILYIFFKWVATTIQILETSGMAYGVKCNLEKLRYAASDSHVKIASPIQLVVEPTHFKNIISSKLDHCPKKK